MNFIDTITRKYDETEIGINLPIRRYVLNSGSDNDDE